MNLTELRMLAEDLKNYVTPAGIDWRQDFEVWAVRMGLDVTKAKYADTYEKADTFNAKLVWEASRAALVVQLPKERAVSPHCREQATCAGAYNAALKDCIKAIQDVGVQVKP